MYLVPTSKQLEVIKKEQDKNITVCSLGYGGGASTALLFKYLTTQSNNSTIIYPDTNSAIKAFQSYKGILSGYGFRFSHTSLIITHEASKKKLKLVSGSDPERTQGLSKELVMFDRPEHCNKDTILKQLYRSPDEMVLATHLPSCTDLYLDEDEYGYHTIDYNRSSWLAILCKDSIIKEANDIGTDGLRLSDEYLADEVRVVTGQTKDNHFIVEKCPEFINKLQNLTSKARIRYLDGDWGLEGLDSTEKVRSTRGGEV